MSANNDITFTFQFTGDFDETHFQECPFATTTLREKVQNALNVQKKFLERFNQVNRIAQRVIDDGRIFRVVLSR
jgi:hypothetical protein